MTFLKVSVKELVCSAQRVAANGRGRLVVLVVLVVLGGSRGRREAPRGAVVNGALVHSPPQVLGTGSPGKAKFGTPTPKLMSGHRSPDASLFSKLVGLREAISVSLYFFIRRRLGSLVAFLANLTGPTLPAPTSTPYSVSVHVHVHVHLRLHLRLGPFPTAYPLHYYY